MVEMIGDCQRESLKFDPRHADLHQISHTSLRHWYLHQCKISSHCLRGFVYTRGWLCLSLVDSSTFAGFSPVGLPWNFEMAVELNTRMTPYKIAKKSDDICIRLDKYRHWRETDGQRTDCYYIVNVPPCVCIFQTPVWFVCGSGSYFLVSVYVWYVYGPTCSDTNELK